jgi:nucleoside-diphosphate-sugar epimerase
MRFLVTGANGFVGRHLCSTLINSGHIVKVLVRSAEFSVPGIEEKFVQDFSSGTDWSAVLKDVDVVIHLAARVHIMNSEELNIDEEYDRVNFNSTENFAKQAVNSGIKRFVYISSIKVNGEFTEQKPFTERDHCHPQDPYALSKYKAEQALFKIANTSSLEVVVIRPPLVYGPGVKANFYSLISAVDKMIPLPLGSLNNKRSMIYVGNLVDAIILSALHVNAVNKVFLVSDQVDLSLNELVRYIALFIGKRCMIFSFPLNCLSFIGKLTGKSKIISRLTQSLQINSSLISIELGWLPPYTVEEGLRHTISWYLSDKASRKKANP